MKDKKWLIIIIILIVGFLMIKETKTPKKASGDCLTLKSNAISKIVAWAGNPTTDNKMSALSAIGLWANCEPSTSQWHAIGSIKTNADGVINLKIFLDEELIGTVPEGQWGAELGYYPEGYHCWELKKEISGVGNYQPVCGAGCGYSGNPYFEKDKEYEFVYCGGGSCRVRTPPDLYSCP